jgi:hypothetical protein
MLAFISRPTTVCSRPPGPSPEVQFLSDIIRKLKFDGVVFKSSLGKGTNLTIFDPDKFIFDSGSENAIKVEGLKYTYSALSLMSDDDEYM